MPDIKDGIIKLWNAGLTGQEIARRFGVTKQYVSQVAKADKVAKGGADRRKAKRK